MRNFFEFVMKIIFDLNLIDLYPCSHFVFLHLLYWMKLFGMIILSKCYFCYLLIKRPWKLINFFVYWCCLLNCNHSEFSLVVGYLTKCLWEYVHWLFMCRARNGKFSRKLADHPSNHLTKVLCILRCTHRTAIQHHSPMNQCINLKKVSKLRSHVHHNLYRNSNQHHSRPLSSRRCKKQTLSLTAKHMYSTELQIFFCLNMIEPYCNDVFV